MTDTSTTPEEITPEQAEADLAALEQSVIDGADVNVADLVTARERFTLAGLIRKRNEKRDAAQALREADERREKTKAKVAAMFSGGQYLDPLVAYDQAVAALDNLAVAIGSNNELLTTAYRAFSAGGVVTTGWDGSTPDGHDDRNSARVAQGEQVEAVISDGVGYTPQNAALWLRAAVHTVAAKHGGLPIPYGSSLEAVVRGDKPAALVAREG
jgi:hypothetical protein